MSTCDQTATSLPSRSVRSEDRQAAGRGEPRVLSILLVSLATLVSLVAIMFFTAAFYESASLNEESIKRLPAGSSEVDDLASKQQQVLSEYRWVDRANGVLAIPIQRAMELTAQRLRSEQ